MANYKKKFVTSIQPSAAALSCAGDNGYTNDGVNSVVTVNIPPTSGEFAGKADHIEVITERKLKASFGAIFTNQPLSVKARAVAKGRTLKIGVMALSPNAPNALVTNNIGVFAVVGSDIYVNSSDPSAFRINGIGPVLASNYNVTGNYTNTSGTLLLGKMRTGIDPQPDPLAKFPIPDTSTMQERSAGKMTINSLLPTILQPGIYRGGIEVRGISIVTMLPGIYVMDGGGFTVTNLSTVAGVDTMIYNTSITQPAGPITINSTGAVAILAPFSGTYQGFSIFQDRNVSTPVTLAGNSVTAVTGTIYAPAAALSLTGLAGVGVATLGGAYIADTITVGGVGNINVDLGANYVRVPDVTLVE
jgi:hypothetical protein